MSNAKYLQGIADEQYGSRKNKSADIQARNIRLYYDYILLERTPATSAFIDLVSNYDLVVHSIASLALQRANTPNAPIHYTFTMLQNMVQTVRTTCGDSIESYGGDLWAIPCSPPPQGLGQGNGAAPCIWALVSTSIPNALREQGFGVAFKCAISRKTAQAEIDLYEGLAQATGGQVSPDRGKTAGFSSSSSGTIMGNALW
eukprot:14455162-Ditylum_brightwellii.AAC.1